MVEGIVFIRRFAHGMNDPGGTGAERGRDDIRVAYRLCAKAKDH
jgi:hypothetical protein